MVKEVASKTNDIAGDGTTTATVLAQAIVREGLKNVAAGANPMDLKRGIDKAVQEVIKSLKAQTRQIGDSMEKIEQIASVSANNDTFIGKMIAEAMTKATMKSIDEAKALDEQSMKAMEKKGIKVYRYSEAQLVPIAKAVAASWPKLEGKMTKELITEFRKNLAPK